MGNFKKFEELPCWKKTREFCKAVSRLINKAKLKNETNLKEQIWKAAGSAMDNIAEGFDDGSSREFIRFLGYSQRSCGEVQSQMYRALDCGYISNSEFKVVYDLASECRMQIKGFRKYLRNWGISIIPQFFSPLII
ncbi:MAG: four helix bundle protein [Candidatus Scalindua sp.]